MKTSIALAMILAATSALAGQEIMTRETCSHFNKPGETWTKKAGRTVAHLFGSKPEGLAAIADMDRSELDKAFGQGTVPGKIPHGDAIGYPIAIAGDLGKPLNGFANDLWRGKVFTVDKDGQHATLVNKILWNKNTQAQVFKASSGFDGKQSIQLNYKNSEMAWARGIVDEIRKVRVPVPGSDGKVFKDLYLGRANLKVGKADPKFVCYFALQFPDQSK